jgi:beta-lactamase regulating signal transducer with metallopeptidase domain/HEAT repeat protein
MQRVLLLVLVVWLVGVAGALLRILGGGFAVRRLLHRAQPVNSQDWRGPLFEAADRLELSDAPRLLMSSELPMPFVAGILRPSIVLPAAAAEWTQDRRRAVLLHELAHVRRSDLALNLIVRIVCALYWFHPLVHVAARRLRAESERACDDLVLHVGTRASTYADHLLDIVRGAGHSRTPAIALPMAQRREFEGRMLAILEADVRREPPRRRHTALVAVATSLIVLPLAAMTPTMTSATPAAEPQPPQSPVVAAETPSEQLPLAERETATPAPASPAPVRKSTTDQRQDTSVIAALRSALRDANDDVRGEAVWALGSLHAKEAAADLAQIARTDASAEVREMAVWSLVTVGDRSAALSALGAAARSDDNAEVRATAVWGLGTFRAETELPALVASLGDADSEVRARAAWALGTIRPKAAPAELMRALEDDDAEVRETSAWALGQIADPAAIGALTRRVSDAEAGEAVLWAIGNIGGEAARPALLEALRTGNDDVRAAAARALAGRGGQNPWPWPWPMPRPHS